MKGCWRLLLWCRQDKGLATNKLVIYWRPSLYTVYRWLYMNLNTLLCVLYSRLKDHPLFAVALFQLDIISQTQDWQPRLCNRRGSMGRTYSSLSRITGHVMLKYVTKWYMCAGELRGYKLAITVQLVSSDCRSYLLRRSKTRRPEKVLWEVGCRYASKICWLS